MWQTGRLNGSSLLVSVIVIFSKCEPPVPTSGWAALVKSIGPSLPSRLLIHIEPEIGGATGAARWYVRLVVPLRGYLNPESIFRPLPVPVAARLRAAILLPYERTVTALSLSGILTSYYGLVNNNLALFMLTLAAYGI